MKNDFEPAIGHRFTFRATPMPHWNGVLVRMEQSGLRPEEETNYQGANGGWQRLIGGLERVLAALV
ncbi:MAG: hypothetical protein M0002_05360 [Rhodospirillales bacterium]|nr:hypothetical protein [Rhodospirillales bacterium]